MNFITIKYSRADRFAGDIDTAMYSGPEGTGEKLADHDPAFQFVETHTTPAVGWMVITEGHEWRIKFKHQTPPGSPPPHAMQNVSDFVLKMWGVK